MTVSTSCNCHAWERRNHDHAPSCPALQFEIPPDDDTVVFTDTDLAELQAMLDHQCTPRWWPHHIGDLCRCGQCGHTWVCCDYSGTLGWRTT